MNRLKKIWLISAFIFGLIFAVGCSANDQPYISSGHSMDVKISIDYPEKSKIKDVTDETFTLEKDSSVLDAMELYCNLQNLSIIVDTTKGKILGINGVENGEFGRKTWTCLVNGEPCTEKQSERILKAGDSILWKYGLVKAKKQKSPEAAQ